MTWIIIIAVVVIAGLAFWMMSGKKEGGEASVVPASPADEPESPAVEETPISSVDEPASSADESDEENPVM